MATQSEFAAEWGGSDSDGDLDEEQVEAATTPAVPSFLGEAPTLRTCARVRVVRYFSELATGGIANSVFTRCEGAAPCTVVRNPWLAQGRNKPPRRAAFPCTPVD